MHPAASTHRTPPAPAIAAAVLALLSAVPAFFALPALALSGGEVGDGGWLVIAVTVVLLVALPVGGVLLLLGRSWLALTLSAGALTAVLLAGYVMGGGAGVLGVLVLVIPLVTTVLTMLPRVRGWVAERRRPRTSP